MDGNCLPSRRFVRFRSGPTMPVDGAQTGDTVPSNLREGRLSTCRRIRNRQSVVAGALLLIAVLVLVGGAMSGGRDRPLIAHRPQLIMDDSVGADFRALALATWERFLAVFAARSGCFGDVRLRASYTLDSRGDYDPATATVTVRVPGTPAMLQSALVHEWAHHLEFQCPAHTDLRPAFLRAQGLPPDTPWRPGDEPPPMISSAWATIPSEQYAEATVELVLGERPIPTLARVTPASIQVIAAWAAGD